MTAVAPMLQGFFDDASLFPPASLPLPSSLQEHHAHRRSWYAPLVGAFVCPWQRVGELSGAEEPVEVSLLVPGGPADVGRALAAAAAVPEAQVTAVEVMLPDGMAPRAALLTLDERVPPDVTGYLEVPRDIRWMPVLDALTVTRYRAKFRTGGVDPQAHPSEWELAEALRAAVQRGVPFKCTAGLHHAVRHTDGQLEQHGFLNLLLAVDLARHGADVAAVAAVLASRSAEAIGREVARVAAIGRLSAARALVVAIGTCSIADPIADLVALGLLAQS
jgi:hypothetical protein